MVPSVRSGCDISDGAPAWRSGTVAPVSQAAVARPPVDRRRLTALLVPIALVTVSANVGSVLMPTLIDQHPEAVIALNSANRNLLLAIGADIGALAFFGIGFARLFLPDPLFYILGRDFGERGKAWLGRQPGGVPATVRWVERAFARADWLAVLVMPNNVVCLLAGMRAMPWRLFLVLNAIGTAGRLTLLWFLGKAFEDELKAIVDFVARYQWWMVGAFLAFSVIQSTVQASRAQERLGDE